MLTLSLIIPVYNEDRHIRACLDAIKNQTVMPDEVLVIDNNCTDETIMIAKQYSFVTVINEPKQGLIAARNKGFNSAISDIYGRIDADSVINNDWVEIVKNRFTNDSKLRGLTGPAFTSFTVFNDPKSKIMSLGYLWWIRAQVNTNVMWGANMAIYNAAWARVAKLAVLNDSDVHEDQDLSLCMAAQGMKIEQDDHLLITTNGQSYRYLPKVFFYARLHIKTKKLHKQNGNLSSSLLPRISLKTKLIYAVLGMFPAVTISVMSLIMYPIDVVMLKIVKSKTWMV